MNDAWASAKEVMGANRVTLGPVASHSWLHQPEHLSFQLARYRAASALIGSATDIVELGCGEGLGSSILINGRAIYYGIDNDAEAITVAQEMYGADDVQFRCADILGPLTLTCGVWDAVLSLDVLEHIPADREADFMLVVKDLLTEDGTLVLGTPNVRFFDLASPQSQVAHINNYDHARLHALMSKHFRVVQSFGLNDVALHLGHPEARHYLLFCGIGPKLG